MSIHHHDKIPAWAWIAPVFAGLLLGLKFAGVVPADTAPTLLLAAVLLGGAVFASVHHAEVLALRLGEPFGSILLAIAVTVIELGLIVSITLAGGEGSETVARDTVFAAAMIVLNGVVGSCLVLGAGRYREQSFQLHGAAAALSVLGSLAVMALVLPSYMNVAPGPYYSRFELLFVAAVSIALYAIFVFVQTVRHREYFLDVAAANEIEFVMAKPSGLITLVSAGLLILSLASVVLLAKLLSAPLDRAIAAAGLPHSVAGVVIAAVVLLPEGAASVRAALSDRLQTSLNLALGSAIATIGLTIPCMAMVSLISGQRLALGLAQENIVLLVLTLFMAALTLGTGRTTVLQGAVHLVIFGVFLMIATGI